MRWLELRIPPVLVVVVIAAAMHRVTLLVPAMRYAVPGSSVLAAVLAVAGGVVAALGVSEFRRAGTTVDPTRPGAAGSVVTTGVYRCSRNPMYLGLALILLALAVRWSHPLAFAGVPAFVAYMNRFQIGPEERALRAKFGPAFSAYVRAVRRWI